MTFADYCAKMAAGTLPRNGRVHIYGTAPRRTDGRVTGCAQYDAIADLGITDIVICPTPAIFPCACPE